MCSLSSFCKLRPKNILLLSDTPEDTCKCQTHENLFLQLDAMGFHYDSSFWGEVLCDTSENSNCWLPKCDECREGKKFSPKKQIDSPTIYKQWKTILVLTNCKGNHNIGNEEPQKFFQKLQMKIFNSHLLMLQLKWIWKDSRPMHFKKTSKAPILKLCKLVTQWPISINNKVKFRVHYGQEAVWIYLLVLCTTTIKPKHSSSLQTIKKNINFLIVHS